jgi:phage-related protein
MDGPVQYWYGASVAEAARAGSVLWIASSRRDLKAFPEPVRRAVGHAIWAAQSGRKHPDAKVLKGFGDASVIEIIEDWQGNT